MPGTKTLLIIWVYTKLLNLKMTVNSVESTLNRKKIYECVEEMHWR